MVLPLMMLVTTLFESSDEDMDVKLVVEGCEEGELELDDDTEDDAEELLELDVELLDDVIEEEEDDDGEEDVKEDLVAEDDVELERDNDVELREVRLGNVLVVLVDDAEDDEVRVDEEVLGSEATEDDKTDKVNREEVCESVLSERLVEARVPFVLVSTGYCGSGCCWAKLAQASSNRTRNRIAELALDHLINSRLSCSGKPLP